MEIFENNKVSLLNTVNCFRKDYSSFLSIWGQLLMQFYGPTALIENENGPE